LIISVCFHETTPLTIKLPNTMEFEIVESEPEIKGASATTSYKNATMNNGVSVLVPQFVKIGDRIKINTETGEYLERAKK
jgi:elongation factor P